MIPEANRDCYCLFASLSSIIAPNLAESHLYLVFDYLYLSIMKNSKIILLSCLFCLLVCAPAPAGKGAEEVSAGYLKGIKLAPDASAKLVLIIPGSGPIDRDGNTPLGESKIYRRLATALFDAYGLASVRVDKRGMFSSRAPGVDPNAVTMRDYADDARRWVNRLRGESPEGCVWILGHSEGGLTALLAGQNPEGICGLVLAAAPGRKTGDILREQLAANPANAPLLPQAFAAIAALEKGERVDVSKLAPPMHGLFYPAVQGFIMDQMQYDPAELIAAISLPVLILQGEFDLQISPERDAERLHKAAPGSKLVLLPGVTHVLKRAASGSLEDNYATYTDPHARVDESVVEAVGGFITSTGPAGLP